MKTITINGEVYIRLHDVPGAVDALIANNHAGHEIVTEGKTSKTFYPRRGCATCDTWLEPIVVRR